MRTTSRAAAAAVTVLIASAALAAPPANPMNERLLSGSEPLRLQVLGSMLRQSPYPCASMTKAAFQAVSPQGQAIWSVSCDRDGDYMLLIAPDDGGSLRVITCDAARNLGLHCWTKLNFAS